MTNDSPAAREGTMSVTLSRPAGTFLYAASKPRLSLDGGDPVALSWGTHRLPVTAGRHRVQAWVPYLLPRRAGRAEAVVAVASGRTAEIEYVAPVVTFAKGHLGAPSRRKAKRSSAVMVFNGIAAVLFVLMLAVTILGR
ncbi:hypothetical protein [Micromonospora eburnea]|uniref:Uncharacterized protein n=1 Tax=Micromonospora eburnea TaxID=227316 RepID=A0A1C6UAP3_9ACTN|nr:hypothetical protein [Micromonospora eburnea]SCL51160.1 hypothetical protein GA0070604_2297 [Micromonospora eburnea]